MKDKKLMVFIPAYNTEKTIEKLLNRIPNEIWKIASEIIVADNHSRDQTFEVALRYKKENKKEKLTVVKHSTNRGYGGNQKWAYNYAIKKGYDLAVMLHGDVQYPPEKIIPLINPIMEGKKDFMFGSRMTGDPRGGGMPLYKYLANIFLSRVENFILKSNLSEFHSGFRAYNLHALNEVPFNRNADGYHFDSEIIIQLLISRKKIGEITIPTFYGDEKCNVPGIKYGLSILGILGEYLLHRMSLKRYEKFEINLKD